MRRRTERRRTAQAWIGSVLVHGTVLAVAWLTAVVSPRPIEYEVIQVQMVEAPDDDFVLETPDPVPPPDPEPEPDPEPPPVQEQAPEPEPEPEEEEPEPDPEPEPPPERAPEPAEVTMQGLQKDYPEYYGEIIFQITRCFQVRWTRGGSWKATVDFVISADGSVPGRDIDLFRSSGNVSFDLAAVEAVECVGTKLGPLPDELRRERLPVRFNFEPIGSGAPGNTAGPDAGASRADPSAEAPSAGGAGTTRTTRIPRAP